MKAILAVAAMVAALVGASDAQAATKVTLSDMHLCCGACVKGVQKAVDSVDGVKATIDDSEGTTVLEGDSDKAVQKAIDAIADAGYHAKSDSKELKMKDDSGAKEGKVKRLELSGLHNCCGGCNKAVQAAIESVDGVQANTAKVRETDFVVEGDFDALALVRALESAGFHTRVKKK